ncbi:MAG: MBL fold metallo-hydrolase [Candidatus Thermoplasmatota archaeon]|nr:MBL fold metallo-hydrolase [Candidatus Thermoplasmatota archaeon]
MVVEQLRIGGDNLSYIVWCPESKMAALIDAGMDISPQSVFLKKNGLKLLYIISTHHHYDHTAMVGELKELTGALSFIGTSDAVFLKGAVDGTLKDDQELSVGTILLKVLETPGHTPGSICIIDDNDRSLFTGDTLFIGDCGRADLPGGDVKALFGSIQRLKALPQDLTVCPGHDYGERPSDTLYHQIRTNRTMLAKDIDTFLGLP